MEIRDFRKFLQTGVLTRVPTPDWTPLSRLPGPPLGVKKLIASMTRTVNYDCGFQNGRCKERRKADTERRGCCCGSCNHTCGYFNYSEVQYLCSDLTDLRLVGSCFDNDTGFWRSGIGCIIPRHLRSGVCLSFNCSRDDLSAEELGLLAFASGRSKHWSVFLDWCRENNHPQVDETAISAFISGPMAAEAKENKWLI